MVALPSTDPIAARRVVRLADLPDLPAAISTPESAGGVAELISQACAQAGFEPKPGPAFTNLQDVLAGPIATGACWTLLYRDLPAHTPARRIAFRPTEPAITIPTTLITRRPPIPPAAVFASAAREYLANA